MVYYNEHECSIDKLSVEKMSFYGVFTILLEKYLEKLNAKKRAQWRLLCQKIYWHIPKGNKDNAVNTIDRREWRKNAIEIA